MFLTQFYYCHLLNKTCLMLRKNTCLNVSTFYDKINTQCLAFNANMVYPRGERDVESHLRNREEKKKSRDRKKERSFSNAILAFIELWITIIGSKCHLLKITIQTWLRTILSSARKKVGQVFWGQFCKLNKDKSELK